MYERSYGYKYAEGGKLDTAAIAKLIRAEIKTAVSEGLLPERWSYSVKIDRFSGGSSIDVTVKGCADAWITCPGYKIGSKRDLPGGGWTAIGCGNVWCKAGGEFRDRPGAEEHMVLTEEAQAAEMTLKRIHGGFNHDGSDAMVDYFDVNYYGGVTFQSARSAEFEAEEKARKQARHLHTLRKPEGRLNMKVRVTLTVDVDQEAWIRDYGCEPSELRQDVRAYVFGQVQDSAAAQAGAITNVEG